MTVSTSAEDVFPPCGQKRSKEGSERSAKGGREVELEVTSMIYLALAFSKDSPGFRCRVRSSSSNWIASPSKIRLESGDTERLHSWRAEAGWSRKGREGKRSTRLRVGGWWSRGSEGRSGRRRAPLDESESASSCSGVRASEHGRR